MTRVEEELCEVTGIRKKRSEERRAYLQRMVESFKDLTDDDWDSLSEEAKEYHNRAVEAYKGKGGKLVDFPADDEDEDEVPAKKSPKAKKAPATSKPAKKKTKAPVVDEDDDDGSDDDLDEPENSLDDDEDEEEAKPVKAKSPKSDKAKPKAPASKKRRAVVEDDEDDDDVDEDEDEVGEEDDEPKRPTKRTARAKDAKPVDEVKPEDLSTQIKRVLLEEDLYMPLDELFDIMRDRNKNVAISKNTLSGIAAGFRNTMKLLDKEGLLKEPLKRGR